MLVDSANVPAGLLVPGDTYELDGLWLKVSSSGAFGDAAPGKSWFVRLQDGAQREHDDADTVQKVVRKAVVA